MFLVDSLGSVIVNAVSGITVTRSYSSDLVTVDLNAVLSLSRSNVCRKHTRIATFISSPHLVSSFAPCEQVTVVRSVFTLIYLS